MLRDFKGISPGLRDLKDGKQPAHDAAAAASPPKTGAAAAWRGPLRAQAASLLAKDDNEWPAAAQKVVEEHWKDAFEHCFIGSSTLRDDGDDLLIFVLRGEKLEPRRVVDERISRGIPDAVRWTPTFALNLALHASYQLRVSAGGALIESRVYAAVDSYDGQRIYPELAFTPSEKALSKITLVPSESFTVSLLSGSMMIFSSCIPYRQLLQSLGNHQCVHAKLCTAEVERGMAEVRVRAENSGTWQTTLAQVFGGDGLFGGGEVHCEGEVITPPLRLELMMVTVPAALTAYTLLTAESEEEDPAD